MFCPIIGRLAMDEELRSSKTFEHCAGISRLRQFGHRTSDFVEIGDVPFGSNKLILIVQRPGNSAQIILDFARRTF
jgi:hypothetical protein